MSSELEMRAATLLAHLWDKTGRFDGFEVKMAEHTDEELARRVMRCTIVLHGDRFAPVWVDMKRGSWQLLSMVDGKITDTWANVTPNRGGGYAYQFCHWSGMGDVGLVNGDALDAKIACLESMLR